MGLSEASSQQVSIVVICCGYLQRKLYFAKRCLDAMQPHFLHNPPPPMWRRSFGYLHEQHCQHIQCLCFQPPPSQHLTPYISLLPPVLLLQAGGKTSHLLKNADIRHSSLHQGPGTSCSCAVSVRSMQARSALWPSPPCLKPA